MKVGREGGGGGSGERGESQYSHEMENGLGYCGRV